jgi:hypothetical protein
MTPVTRASVRRSETPPGSPPQRAAAAPRPPRAPQPGSGEPINPVKVKTITVKAGDVQTASLVPLVAPPQATVAPAAFRRTHRAAPRPPARRASRHPGTSAGRRRRPAPPRVYQTASAPPRRSRRATGRARSPAAPGDPGRRVPEGTEASSACARRRPWQAGVAKPSRSREDRQGRQESSAPASPASDQSSASRLQVLQAQRHGCMRSD